MNFALPIDTYSPDQISELLLELQDLSGLVRDQAARSADADPTTLSANMEQLLGQNNITIDNPGALEELAKALQQTLDHAPTMHILLAAMPPRSIKRQLTTWFRTEIHPLTLLTFAARSDLGGGLVVQGGSHLYDLSFRRSIIDNKARLTEIAGV